MPLVRSVLLLFLAVSTTLSSNQSFNIDAKEIRLDGVINGVYPTLNLLCITVSSFTLPNGRSSRLDHPALKTVTINAATYFRSLNNTTKVSALRDVKAGSSAFVIGKDLGSGQTLPARLVILVGPSEPRPTKVTVANPTPPAKRFEVGQILRPKTTWGNRQADIRAMTTTVRVNGRNHRVRMIRAHLDTVRLKVGLGQNRVGLTESLAGIANRYGAIAGINGSFFDAYDSGPIKRPNMALITNGQLVFHSTIGTMLGFTEQNETVMDRAPNVLSLVGNQRWQNSAGGQASSIWLRVQEAMGCGPRLLTDGTVTVDPVSEGFRDPKVLRLSTLRSALGVTRDRWLLMVITSGTIRQVAEVMQALGAQQAMNLDGGGSAGLWMSGYYLTSPGRAISNALLVLKR